MVLPKIIEPFLHQVNVMFYLRLVASMLIHFVQKRHVATATTATSDDVSIIALLRKVLEYAVGTKLSLILFPLFSAKACLFRIANQGKDGKGKFGTHNATFSRSCSLLPFSSPPKTK